MSPHTLPLTIGGEESRSRGYGSCSDINSSSASERRFDNFEQQIRTRPGSEDDIESQEGRVTSQMRCKIKQTVKSFTSRPAWLREYNREFFKGDCVAACTVASLYIPLCFSFAQLGRVPPASSLFAFVIHPVVYALLGSSQLMVVGPEATGSLLIGSLIRKLSSECPDDTSMPIMAASTATALAGFFMLVAGTLRLGFLDNVLSRPLMIGFIAGVGFVLVVEQAILGFGLASVEKEHGIGHASAMTKLLFLLVHVRGLKWLSTTMWSLGLALILLFGSIKKIFGAQHKWLKLFPDRLVILAVASFVTYQLGLDSMGIEVIGSVGTPTMPTISWPFPWTGPASVQTISGTALQIALLGYVESSIASKSLKSEHTGRRFSASVCVNRELNALGAANLIGGFASTLPAFGGFGRSKLSVQAGGTTPMTNLLLAGITFFCVYCVAPMIYFIPEPALAAMSAAVGISMITECHDGIVFFIGVRAWKEICILMAVFLSIGFHSMGLGIVTGLILSLCDIVNTASRSDCEITHGSKIDCPESGPRIERRKAEYTVVHLGKSLTFVQCSQFLADTCQSLQQPALTPCIILNMEAMSSIDACGMQSVSELIHRQLATGIKVILCRPYSAGTWTRIRSSGLLDGLGERFVIVSSLVEAKHLERDEYS